MIRPTSTYRLQFRNGVTFETAAALAPYLAKLGISHLYASPIFAAVPGSTHGYDVTDFREIDPALGGIEGFRSFVRAMEAEGIGLILDFVPNHMGASPFNPWWRDILEWGQDSDYREHFDIDWSSPKLLVPVLGELYGDALQSGKLGLAFDPADGGISFTYYDMRLPLSPLSYARILGRVEDAPFADLARRFAVARPETVREAKEELAALARDAAIGARIHEILAAIVSDKAALHELHEAQVWRVAYWRTAREGLTYRRFFEIADLVGVRVERTRVFDDVHALLKELIAGGEVDGVRIDHIDGLADPKSYLARLQEAIGSEEPFYVLIEKILEPGEDLRPSWPVAGTTGYEFIQALANVFVDPRGAAPLTEAYRDFLGTDVDYAATVRETKRRILTRNLAGELDFLRDLAKGLAERDPATRDFGADSLRRALLELAASLPVYRTYVNVEGADDTDRTIIAAAVEAAKSTREVEDGAAIDFIARLLLLDFSDPEMQAAALVFGARFQQTTGPVMAKAVEDTVYYRYNRLVALNEVGGDPASFGAPVSAFHDTMQARLKTQPLGLSATATHDTKRGEDARARIYAIGEMPRQWGEAVRKWSAMLGGHAAGADAVPVPEPEIEWLFYQSLVGVWPADLEASDRLGLSELQERLDAYMLKAVREAKLGTSWASPSPDYEDQVARFVRQAFANHDFLSDFRSVAEPLFVAGAVNALSQLAIKLAAPGVPDIYFGTELWDFSLVDPDNRRPVDFALRQTFLDDISSARSHELLGDWRSGRAKLSLMQAGLALRREHPELFAEGEYLQLEVVGDMADYVVAFARRHESKWLITVAMRLPLRMLDGAAVPLAPADRWGDTQVMLPSAMRTIALQDIVTARTLVPSASLAVADLLSILPIALLRGR